MKRIMFIIPAELMRAAALHPEEELHQRINRKAVALVRAALISSLDGEMCDVEFVANARNTERD